MEIIQIYRYTLYNKAEQIFPQRTIQISTTATL